MAAKNESAFETAFTVSVEAREGVTTGISAHDRAHTIQVAIDPRTEPHDLVQPGHVFPLKARSGGVLERTGQTEAGVDLARLAGLIPAAVICEVMRDDGQMARIKDLIPYCERHGLKMITVADLVKYRRRTEKLVERVAAAYLPTEFGEFDVVGYRSLVDDKHHVALVKGDVDGEQDVLVRVHSECLTGDVFHSRLCDCGEQLDLALERIEREEWDPGAHQHRHFRTMGVEPEGDAISGRKLLMWNDDVEIALCRPSAAMEHHYRNGEGDEIVFVHEGKGTLETIFGDLPYRDGDYIVIPRGTTYRFVPEGEQRYLVFTSPGLIMVPTASGLAATAT